MKNEPKLLHSSDISNNMGASITKTPVGTSDSYTIGLLVGHKEGGGGRSERIVVRLALKHSNVAHIVEQASNAGWGTATRLCHCLCVSRTTCEGGEYVQRQSDPHQLGFVDPREEAVDEIRVG